MTIDEMTFEQKCALLGYTPKNRRLTNAEAAEVLGIKPNTLEVKRHYGIGPEFVKPPKSKKVYYLEQVLVDYMLSGRRTSTSQPIARRA